MKGFHPYFALVTIIFILFGIFLTFRGYHGDGIGALPTMILGIFIVIKEILDLAH